MLTVVRERDDTSLCVECVHLSTLAGHTAELIGTNINANPYGKAKNIKTCVLGNPTAKNVLSSWARPKYRV